MKYLFWKLRWYLFVEASRLEIFWVLRNFFSLKRFVVSKAILYVQHIAAKTIIKFNGYILITNSEQVPWIHLTWYSDFMNQSQSYKYFHSVRQKSPTVLQTFLYTLLNWKKTFMRFLYSQNVCIYNIFDNVSIWFVLNINFLFLLIYFIQWMFITSILKEKRNLYFCVTPQNQVLHKCALLFFK